MQREFGKICVGKLGERKKGDGHLRARRRVRADQQRALAELLAPPERVDERAAPAALPRRAEGLQLRFGLPRRRGVVLRPPEDQVLACRNSVQWNPIR